MKEYPPKADRLKAAQAALPAELAHCICKRSEEKPMSDQDIGVWFLSNAAAKQEITEVPKEEEKLIAEEESIEDPSSDEDSDIEVVGESPAAPPSEENDLDKALRISRSDTGGIPQSDSQDEDLRKALQDSAKGFEENKSKAAANLCEWSGCTPADAAKALVEAGFDETVAALKLLEDQARASSSSTSSSGGKAVVKREPLQQTHLSSFPQSLQRQRSCPPGAHTYIQRSCPPVVQGVPAPSASWSRLAAECVIIDVED